MAVKDKLTQDFLKALEEVERVLSLISFVKHSFQEKGLAYFVEFKKHNTIVEFLFGPPEFQIEMIIYTSKGKFAFRDLLEIPVVRKWVDDNRYVQLNERNIKNELMWFVELMKVSLKEVE
jgi:hypothetical protein